MLGGAGSACATGPNLRMIRNLSQKQKRCYQLLGSGKAGALSLGNQALKKSSINNRERLFISDASHYGERRMESVVALGMTISARTRDNPPIFGYSIKLRRPT